ncbi:hypothetical protein RU97_GL000035 [Enterococcus canis]|uniref:CsbD-like domain-containing protein n=2 Tax=Enterococcus canis TaxID=214095 RepID=A0A1L8RJB9_9ENTE|nr:hypothetical protein RU97_GL000035 [Enterococcus canis]
MNGRCKTKIAFSFQQILRKWYDLIKGGNIMSSLKDTKDKVVGKTKEKLASLTDNEALKAEGKQQAEQAEAKEQSRKERLSEIEDQYEEKKAQNTDFTKERKEQKERKDHHEQQISREERIEAERVRKYTGIEDKL